MSRPKRKAIPNLVRIAVGNRQDGRCAECGELIFGYTEYDHRPSLVMRPVKADGTDYDPPQLDPNFIDALHADCHQKRTTGRAIGASRTVTTKGSDIWLKTKFARLERKKRLEAAADEVLRGTGHFPPKKAKIPSRPFPKQKRGFK